MVAALAVDEPGGDSNPSFEAGMRKGWRACVWLDHGWRYVTCTCLSERQHGFMSLVTMASPCEARSSRSRSPPSARATFLKMVSTLAARGTTSLPGAVVAEAGHDRPKTSRSKVSNRRRSRILSASWVPRNTKKKYFWYRRQATHIT